MTLIFGVGEVRLSNTGKVSLDSVQNAWETEQERYNNNLNFNIHCLGSEKLLNILERLHSIVCKKYSIYEGLNDLSGLIDKAARLWVPEKKEPHSRHGRISFTCRLRPSTATAADKNRRIKEIRKLLGCTYAHKIQRMLKKIEI